MPAHHTRNAEIESFVVYCRRPKGYVYFGVNTQEEVFVLWATTRVRPYTFCYQLSTATNCRVTICRIFNINVYL